MSTLAPTASIIPLYAGFWRRAAAAIVDSFVIIPLNFALSLALPQEPWINFAAAVVASCAYYATMHASRLQATLGKLAFGIKVASLAGARIGWPRAALRYLGSFVSAALLGIGYFMAAYTSHRQALHDLLVGTVVVNRRASAADVATGGGVMPVTAGVLLAVVILFAVPFFGGMLAAIAIPAYQDYTVRAKVNEVVAASLPLRNEVQKALEEKRPVTAGLFPSPSPYAQTLAVLPDGRLLIQMSQELAPGGRIMFSPSIETPGAITWRCETTQIEKKHLPPACRG